MSYQRAMTMRQSILDYLQPHPGSSAVELAKHLGVDKDEIQNWLTQCLKHEEIRYEMQYVDGHRCGKYYALKDKTYWSGPGTDEFKAIAARIGKANKPKPLDPHVKRVMNGDKIPKEHPHYKPAGGQGNVDKGPHIGCGSWGVV